MVLELDPKRPEVWIGRSRECQVRLPHPAISLCHGKILSKPPGLWLEDKGSTNGTLLNGKPLPSHSPALIQAGDVFCLGPFWISLLGSDAHPALGEKTGTEQVAMELVRGFLDKGPDARPWLAIDKGSQAGQRCEIPLGQVIIVGRDPSCDLVLSDRDSSRRHARVFCDLNGAWIDDMESKNGVWLDGNRVSGRTRICHGQTFCVGETGITFFDPAEEYIESLEKMADKLMGPRPESAGDLTGNMGMDGEEGSPRQEVFGAQPDDPSISVRSRSAASSSFSTPRTDPERSISSAVPGKPSSRWFWLLIGIGVMVAAAAAFALFMVLTRS